MDKAVALLWLGDYDDALVAIDRALALDEKVAFFHANRGYILQALGRGDDAIVSLHRAVRLDPALGFDLVQDPAFESLRERQEFRALATPSARA
jgi:tetratricopeptide (TPR) repeat protein